MHLSSILQCTIIRYITIYIHKLSRYISWNNKHLIKKKRKEKHKYIRKENNLSFTVSVCSHAVLFCLLDVGCILGRINVTIIGARQQARPNGLTQKPTS
jgi:hypothetical protein